MPAAFCRPSVFTSLVCCALLSSASSISLATPVRADEVPAVTSTVDVAHLPDRKKTSLGLYLTAADAAALKSGRPEVLIIDVRTRAETTFVGIASMADKNVPYMQVSDLWDFDAKKGRYKLVHNPDFPAAIAKVMADHKLGKDALIILMCRSGDRSAAATNYLAKIGYTQVYSVIDGFEGDMSPNGRRTVNGWKNSGLKWSYKISPEVAYESPSF